jgi:HD-like signal output (HDOD) protein
MLLYSETFENASREAEAEGKTIFETESRYFMASHAEIGHILVQKWHFPPGLCNAIRYHHQPYLSKESPLETAIVHVADVLVRAKGIGYAGDLAVPAVNPDAWKLLGLSESDIKDILNHLEDGASAAREGG